MSSTKNTQIFSNSYVENLHAAVIGAHIMSKNTNVPNVQQQSNKFDRTSKYISSAVNSC